MSDLLCVTLISLDVEASMERQAHNSELKMAEFTTALAAANGEVIPTIDDKGRLHAPHSGYVSSDGHIFDKGQYIPTLVDEYRGRESLKVKVKGEDFINALQADAELSKGLGKTWFDNDGIMFANLYLDAAASESKSVIAVVRKVEASYPVTAVRHTLDGKQVVTGTVISLWSKQSEWGVQHGFNVRLADGSVYQGTLPKTVHDASEGDTITFSATFDVDSPYFKRPSKAKLVVKAEEAA